MPEQANAISADGKQTPRDLENLTPRAIIDRILEAAKIGVWPLTVIFILLFLKAPLLKILDQVPDLMRSARTISIGAYKIEINAEMRSVLPQIAGDHVRKIIEAADHNAFRLIMSLNLLENMRTCDGFRWKEPEQRNDLTTFQKLAAQGLVLVDVDSIEVKKYEAEMIGRGFIQGEPRCYATQPTDLGKDTQEAVTRFLELTFNKNPAP